jgi:putative redox protein
MQKNEKSDSTAPDDVTVKWIDGLQFVATDSSGHSIVMDAPTASGGEGSGFTPIQLLLAALGGCTGIDVVHILRKQRQQISSLEVKVSGKRVADPPRVYNEVHVEYRISGMNIDERAVQRAIRLSEDTYCSAGAMLRARAKLTSDYNLH